MLLVCTVRRRMMAGRKRAVGEEFECPDVSAAVHIKRGWAKPILGGSPSSAMPFEATSHDTEPVIIEDEPELELEVDTDPED